MKYQTLSISLVAMGLVFTAAAQADSMVVIKGKAVFLVADDQLTVLPDTPDDMLACTFSDGLFMPGASAGISIPVPGAIDVKVIGGQAYVGTSNPGNGAALNDFIKFDISACLPEGPFRPVRAHANLISGELVIPCVEIDGNEYNVVMKQRGNSMNWRVNFVGTGCY